MQNILGPWLVSLRQYTLMCLFLSSPERLPYHPYCIPMTVFAYFAVGVALVDEQRSYGAIGAQILVELVLLGIVTYAALHLKRLLPRLQQTLSALIGINLVITVVTIPVYRAISNQQDPIDAALFYATIAILVWNLAVLSMIFKRALEIPTQMSVILSFTYFMLYLAFSSLI